MDMSYKESLSTFGPVASDAEIAAEVARLGALASRNENTRVWTECLASVDLTSLGVTDSDCSVSDFVGRAGRFSLAFPHLPAPASVCVWPSFVDVAGLALGGSGIAITSVAGGFPSSQTFIEVKMLEVAMAVESGADEIDVVISLGEMVDGEYDRMAGTLALLRDEVGEGTVLKVIVESGVLGTARQIRDASLLAMMAGADFVKTSTGKTDVAATPGAAVVMCGAIRDFHAATGRRVGFKVAGGVRTAADASLYYTIVEEILGPEWLTPSLFRIGASALANGLVSAIEGRDIKYF
jgi:deoxyribose-phosphate aldolase